MAFSELRQARAPKCFLSGVEFVVVVDLRTLLMVVILVVVILGLVAKEDLALDQPGSAEGKERERFAPEKDSGRPQHRLNGFDGEREHH